MGISAVQNKKRERNCHKYNPLSKDWRSQFPVSIQISQMIALSPKGTCRCTVSPWTSMYIQSTGYMTSCWSMFTSHCGILTGEWMSINLMYLLQRIKEWGNTAEMIRNLYVRVNWWLWLYWTVVSWFPRRLSGYSFINKQTHIKHGSLLVETAQTELDTDLCQKLGWRMGGNNPRWGHKETVAPISAQWASVLVHREC